METERLLFYKLDEHHIPHPCEAKDLDAPKHVARTVLAPYTISTVFLGIDHQFLSDGPPILFETMIFGGKFDSGEYQTRCSTWAEAEIMHQKAVSVAEAACGDEE
jgi:hypothetical protein